MGRSKVSRRVAGMADHLLGPFISRCRGYGEAPALQMFQMDDPLHRRHPPSQTGSDVKGNREGGQLWGDIGVTGGPSGNISHRGTLESSL